MKRPDRRSVLLGGLGVGGVGAAALIGGSEATAQTSAAPGASSAPSSLAHLATLRSYRSQRSSSYDRSGGNADFVKVEAGATVPLLETHGPGMVTHIWFTISSREDFHLKKLVLRAYWDGEAEPSVEVPVGDFFGLTLGDYFLYQSALTTVSSVKALNAYFPMPFGKSARITVTNEGQQAAGSFYYNIDFITFAEMPPDMGYFHAQYRQAAPCHGVSVPDKKNLNGENNYVFFEAEGRGHFVGVTHGVIQNHDGWWGEGDEMIFVDGADRPVINGTGTEDYYNGAWNFGGINGATPFSYPHNGAPYIVDAERVGGRYALYRWHLEDPVTFDKSIKVTIEHGHANDRSDNFFSAAFWYQTEPHAKFPALPPVAERIPGVIDVGGPGARKL
jgi:hypothetical protein